MTLKGFNPFRTGKLVLYQVTYTRGWHGFEMIPFAILGVIGGLYGGLLIKCNMMVARWRKSSRWAKFPILEVMIAAVFTALINFPNQFMKAQSSEVVYMLFAECSAVIDDRFGICKTGAASTGVIVLLLEASLLGFLLASITFGLQIPAGIILPSMAIGALYGRALGMIVEIWQANHASSFIFSACQPDVPCITPGTYAVIGAASALGGVTRMTVSIVVIMFELTGALTYVLPIMIAVMISKWIGDAFGHQGIYEKWIEFKEYPFLDNRDESAIPDISVAQIMTQADDLASLTSTGHTLETVQEFLLAHPYRGFPVVLNATNNILIGYISRMELMFALKTAAAIPKNLPPSAEVFFVHQPMADPQTSLDMRPWMDQTPIALSEKSSLQITVAMFQRLGLRYVLFCDRGALGGLLTKKDIWYILSSSNSGSLETEARIARGGGSAESRGLLHHQHDRESINSPTFER